MRETVKSLRVYMFLAGGFGILSGVLGLTGSASHGASLPVAVGMLLVGLAWFGVALRLEPLLRGSAGVVIGLFALGALGGLATMATGLLSGERGPLIRGLGVVAIALYLAFNASRLARELRVAPGATPAR